MRIVSDARRTILAEMAVASMDGNWPLFQALLVMWAMAGRVAA